eukprot:TRINITY_DN88088_c0_g1_i1.p1 TRINITY_DN88088_c0_g1~~TRINITY_DN88088_c0_g1_i1.p1  ORF type:complete len:1103 (-),score=136.21 TRINITY_DN88088_c0_g1_i1:4307-7615(-)
MANLIWVHGKGFGYVNTEPTADQENYPLLYKESQKSHIQIYDLNILINAIQHIINIARFPQDKKIQIKPMERETSKSIKSSTSPQLRPKSARSSAATKAKSPRYDHPFAKPQVTAGHKQRNGSLLLSRERTCCSYNRSVISGCDKEDLYHELILAKQAANELKEENTKLKTKVQLAEQEANKKTEHIKELLYNMEIIEGASGSLPRTGKGKAETKLEIELKKQIKALKQEKDKVVAEYTNLKKNVKTTKLQELALEVQAFSEECQRLRRVIEEVSSKKTELTPEEIEAIEEKMYQQAAIIKNLTQENETLLSSLQQKDQELNDIKLKLEKEVQKNSKLAANRKIVIKQKKLINENTKTIQNLKEQLTYLKSDNRGGEFITYKRRISELLKSQSDLKEKLELKDKKIKALEAKNMRSGQNSVISVNESECRGLKDKLAEYEQQIELLSQKSALNSTQAPKKTPTVTLDKVKWPATELRLCLRIAKIPFAEIKEKLFPTLELEDTISVHELVKTFKRKPLNLKSDALLLGRYLVEPTDAGEIEFSELIEAPLKEILAKMQSVIGEYQLWTEEDQQKLQLAIEEKLEKIADKLSNEIPVLNAPTISREIIENVLKKSGANLTAEEMDYVTLKPYEELRDINALKSQYVVDMLEAAVERYQKKVEELPFDVAESGKKQSESKTDTEYQTIDEDQMILIAQKCFYEIAQKLLARNLNIHSLYKNRVFTKKIDGEDVELLTQPDFINGIQELNIEDMQPLQYACLIQVLAINDEDKHLRVQDLVQILEDYGVSPETPSLQKEETELYLDFETLDKVSMVLMLALTEYMMKSKATLQSLFGESMRKKRTKSGAEIEALESNEFFKVLASIGINIEEKEHQNLKKFLCYDEKTPDQFSVEKLAAAIDEFGSNEDLREFAHKCYEELVSEDFADEGEESRPGKEQHFLPEFEDDDDSTPGANEGNNTLQFFISMRYCRNNNVYVFIFFMYQLISNDPLILNMHSVKLKYIYCIFMENTKQNVRGWIILKQMGCPQQVLSAVLRPNQKSLFGQTLLFLLPHIIARFCSLLALYDTVFLRYFLNMSPNHPQSCLIGPQTSPPSTVRISESVCL